MSSLALILDRSPQVHVDHTPDVSDMDVCCTHSNNNHTLSTCTHPHNPQLHLPGLTQVGLIACNDYILLECCIYAIVKRHFAGHPAYVQILDLFHEVRVACCGC